ncbi:isoprenylcysteine carboxylmethyltransferase family protein [Myxococcota bacterium]|nr:isoprenylcysteine carboxylmethyltransferase family protein [Myxococcota bacterium]MCZ7616911.1 isoprenylcysteine carboxylmethyltransferase family protein [Myxococcota bacterium]
MSDPALDSNWRTNDPPRRRAPLVLWSLLAAGWFALNFFVLFPAALLWSTGTGLIPPPGATRWLGGALLVAAHVPLLAQLRAFIVEGHGTQLPLRPPERIVQHDLYGRVRNPMYWNYVAIALGEAVLYRSLVLVAYSAVLFALAHVYVVRVEEPGLRRRFGDDYDAYCTRVPRWLPRGRNRAGPRRSGPPD